MQTASKKVVNGWAMYDWASSSYNLVITSTIFPTYFEAVAVDNPSSGNTVTFLGRQFENTALYNYAIAIAMLIVACLSPLLSSIADYKGNKKKFLQFFLTVGSIACAMMFFFQRDTLMLGIISIIIACVGFWGAQVFYNSFLPEIAAPEDRDRISAKGFSYGYVGSVLLQLICFVFVMKHEMFGITEDRGAQLSFLLTGFWWWGFGQFSLSRLPKPVPAGSEAATDHLLSRGYKELGKVWSQVKKLSKLKRYLISFFFYNMGVQTVMLVAALYGKSELQLKTETLIMAILIIQLIAIPGAYLISLLSSKIGNLKTLMILVVLWILMCVVAYYLPVGGVVEFCALGAGVGFIMGGIQSLSRSTYSKLMPETRDTASFFSFYDVTEKVAAVVGIFSFGYITELTGSQRGSVLALAVFFIIGLLLLFYANAAKTERS